MALLYYLYPLQVTHKCVNLLGSSQDEIHQTAEWCDVVNVERQRFYLLSLTEQESQGEQGQSVLVEKRVEAHL